MIDYDALFGQLVTNPETAYKIEIPEAHKFADIHSNTNIPEITNEDVEKYCTLSDRQNMVSSKNMYAERYLLCSRAAQEGDFFYATGICAAEMRKSVKYNVTIKFKKNIIIEAQCECAAGLGPHAQCKHVIVLMLGLAEFSDTKFIKLQCSPTSVLQSFHQPSSSYRGEAMKMENIQLSQKQNLEIAKFDPRPNKPIKEKYIENFQNEIVNFVAISASKQSKHSMPMPMLNLIKPANKMAICKDHDYLEISPEEAFLNSLQLNEIKLQELERTTKSNKLLWRKERLKRLQSSNFGKICKLRGDKKKLALSLLCNVDVSAPALTHGIKYEAQAIRKLSETLGITVDKCGLFVHKDFQFLASTPDGLIGNDGVVEIKCPFSAKSNLINPETVSYLYLCDQTGNYKLNNNHDYYYQVQGQLLCSGRNYALFVVYTFVDCIIIKISRDEDFINKMLVTLQKFYEEHYKFLFLCKYYYNVKI